MSTPAQNLTDPLDALIGSLPPSRPKTSNRYGAYDLNTEGAWTLQSDAPKVKDWFKSAYGRDLPVSAFGQSHLHSGMGLNHSNSMDVGLNPTSAEGQALISHLRENNIPFLAYDRPVKGAATAAHVHVGFPSHGFGVTPQQKSTGRQRQPDSLDSLISALPSSSPTPTGGDELDSFISSLPNASSPTAPTPPSQGEAVGASPTNLPSRGATPSPANSFPVGTLTKRGQQAVRGQVVNRVRKPPQTDLPVAIPGMSKEEGEAYVRNSLAATDAQKEQGRLGKAVENTGGVSGSVMMRALPRPTGVESLQASDIPGAIAARRGVASTPIPIREEQAPEPPMSEGQRAFARRAGKVLAALPPQARGQGTGASESLNHLGSMLAGGLRTEQDVIDLLPKGLADQVNALALRQGMTPGGASDIVRSLVGTARQTVAEAERVKPMSNAERGAAFVTQLAGDLAQVGVASAAVGPVAAFGAQGYLGSRGEGASVGRSAVEGAKGVATGALFEGTGEMPLVKRAPTVFAGSYGLEKATGASDKEALRSAAMNTAFSGLPDVVRGPQVLRDAAQARIQRGIESDLRSGQPTETIAPPVNVRNRVSSARGQNALVGAEESTGGASNAGVGEVVSSSPAGGEVPPAQEQVRHVDVQARRKRSTQSGQAGQFRTETSAEAEARRAQVGGQSETAVTAGEGEVVRPEGQAVEGGQGVENTPGEVGGALVESQAGAGEKPTDEMTRDEIKARGRRLANEKEPWEMSRAEYDVYSRADYYPDMGVHSGNEILAQYDKHGQVDGERRWVIERALEQGKSVPPEVLTDYPDLAASGTLAKGEPPAVRGRAKVEKVNARTGLKPSQADYLANELVKVADRHIAEVSGEGANSPEEIRRAGGLPKGSFREPMKEPVTIKVPDDGEFTIRSAQGANRLHQEITGKPIEGFGRASKGYSAGGTSEAERQTRRNEQARRQADEAVKMYGEPLIAAAEIRRQVKATEGEEAKYRLQEPHEVLSELERRAAGKTAETHRGFYGSSRGGEREVYYERPEGPLTTQRGRALETKENLASAEAYREAYREADFLSSRIGQLKDDQKTEFKRKSKVASERAKQIGKEIEGLEEKQQAAFDSMRRHKADIEQRVAGEKAHEGEAGFINLSFLEPLARRVRKAVGIKEPETIEPSFHLRGKRENEQARTGRQLPTSGGRPAEAERGYVPSPVELRGQPERPAPIRQGEVGGMDVGVRPPARTGMPADREAIINEKAKVEPNVRGRVATPVADSDTAVVRGNDRTGGVVRGGEGVGREAAPPTIKERSFPLSAEAAEPGDYLTGAKVAVTRAERERLGQSPADLQAWKSVEDSYHAGRSQVEQGRIDPQKVAEDVARKPRPLTADEVGALTYERAKILTQHGLAFKDALRAMDAKNEVDAAEARIRMQGLEDRLRTNSDALEKGGREQSAAFNARKMLVKADYSLAHMVDSYRAETGKEPTGEVRKQIEGQAVRIKELEGKLAEHQERFAKQDAENAVGRMKADSNREARQAKRAQTKQALDEEYASLKAQFVKAKAETKGVQPSGLASIDPEGKLTPLVLKMARNRVKAGVNTVEGLVDEIHSALKEHVEGLTKRDVRDLISGYGKEAKDNRSADAVELARLRAEMQKLSKQEDVAKGVRSARREGPPDWLPGAKRRLQRQIDDYERRAGEKDFSKPERAGLVYDREGNRLRTQLESTKQDYENLKERDRLANRPGWEKGLDLAVRWGRFAKLTYVSTLGKLTSAATGRIVINPLEEVVGGLESKLMPGLARRAPREGGLSVKAEVEAVSRLWKKESFRAFLDKLKTGQSDLDLLYGSGGKALEEQGIGGRVLGAPGRAHGAMKELPRQAEFYRAFEKRLEYKAREGQDIKDPVVQQATAMEAYADSQRTVLMQPNFLSDAFNRTMRSWEREGGSKGKLGAKLMRLEFPITRIPVNFAGEALNYTFGSVRAAGQTAYLQGKAGVRGLKGEGFKSGFAELSPEQADSLMRAWKKGGVGLGMVALGFLSPGTFGGYYQKGEKREGSEPGAGELRLFGHNLPKWAGHIPILEAAQFGATMRRVYEATMKKENSKSGAAESAVIGAGEGLLKEVPFYEDPLKFAEAVEGKSEGVNRFFGQQVRGMIPGAFQEASRYADRYPSGETVRRKREGFTDEVIEGTPWRKNLSVGPVFGSRPSKGSEEVQRLDVQVRGVERKDNEPLPHYEERKARENARIGRKIDDKVSTGYYQTLTDEKKREAIRKAIRDAVQ